MASTSIKIYVLLVYKIQNTCKSACALYTLIFLNLLSTEPDNSNVSKILIIYHFIRHYLFIYSVINCQHFLYSL